MWNEPWLGIIGRWGLGLLMLFALLALSAMPFQIAHLSEIRPAFMLMAVYYWTILRPLTLPPPLVFVIGLVLDLLGAWPFGLHALILVVVQWVTRRQRKFLLGQSFMVIWAGFALMAAGAGAAQWVVFALFDWSLVSFKPILMSTLLSFFLFPLAALPLAMVHRALAQNTSSGA